MEVRWSHTYRTVLQRSSNDAVLQVTEDAEDEVQLVLHRGPREQRSTGDHLVEDTAHPP